MAVICIRERVLVDELEHQCIALMQHAVDTDGLLLAPSVPANPVALAAMVSGMLRALSVTSGMDVRIIEDGGQQVRRIAIATGDISILHALNR